MDIKNYLSYIEKINNSTKSTKIEIDLDKPLSNQFEEVSSALQNIDKPVLYWFECCDENDAQFMFDLYSVKRPAERASPPINKNLSRVLYLGVRQGGKYKRDKTFSRIRGRIYHHYGLYDIATTQGLQLNHWATNCGKKLNRIINEFDIDSIEYLYILEKLYALELKPMFGKH